MSNEFREMLAILLDIIYGNWLDTISSTRGVYQVARLKEEGWITDLLYDDEVRISALAVKQGAKLIALIVRYS